MGWRFRKSVKILPGIRLNFGKKGFTSATFGGKYFKTNVSSKGTRNTFSIPGTGLSYQTYQKASSQSASGILYNPTPTCWTCPKCMMINLPESNACEMCERENPRIAQAASIASGKPYWYCSKCYTGNPPNNSHCRSCKTFHTLPVANKISPASNQVLVVVIAGIALLIGFILIVLAIDTARHRQTSADITPVSSRQASTLTETSPTPFATPTPKKTVSESKTKTQKSATVIMTPAEIHQTAKSDGEVIHLLTEGANIKVLKQKGAWFLIQFGQVKGWVHGNDIRFIDDSQPVNTVTLPETYSSSLPSYSSSSSYSSSYKSSSSSYRPKTVSVRSYTRKDGTFVRSHMRSAPRSRY
jgi:hypothetical protein